MLYLKYLALIVLIFTEIHCRRQTIPAWTLNDFQNQIYENPSLRSQVLKSYPIRAELVVYAEKDDLLCTRNEETLRFCKVSLPFGHGWIRAEEISVIKPKTYYSKGETISRGKGVAAAGQAVWAVPTNEKVHPFASEDMKGIVFYHKGARIVTWDLLYSENPQDRSPVLGTYVPKTMDEMVGKFVDTTYNSGTRFELEILPRRRFRMLINHCEGMGRYEGTVEINSSQLKLHITSSPASTIGILMLEMISKDRLVVLDSIDCNPNMGDFVDRVN